MDQVAGEGTRFVGLGIPRSPTAGDARKVAAMRDRQKTILVVDDDDDMRTLISVVVRRKGYAVVTAANGLEGLAKLESPAKIDLAIFDVTMPVLDGLEALRRLRAGGHADLPVVLLTAHRTGADVLRGYESGSDYYLSKPFEAQGLLNIVDYLIGDLTPDERARLEAAI